MKCLRAFFYFSVPPPRRLAVKVQIYDESKKLGGTIQSRSQAGGFFEAGRFFCCLYAVEKYKYEFIYILVRRGREK